MVIEMFGKIGRNDPCWCGSGKKYKVCHEAFDEKINQYARMGHIVPKHNIIKTPQQIEKIKESCKINIAILDYLESNMDVLTQRLKKRGYDCNCETTLRTELQQTAQAMAPLVKTERSVPIARYAFDVRT